jgi:hypothetical protein
LAGAETWHRILNAIERLAGECSGPNCDVAHFRAPHSALEFAVQREEPRDRPMWDESECGDKRNSAADVLSSWLIVGVIALGVAVGLGVQLFMPTSIMASRDAVKPGEIPTVLSAIAPVDDDRQR